MAKKFVRGITDIKNIEHQDLDTNNVNDLLSDGKHNFIHRKKQDGTEEYHNLTDNIKTIKAVDNGLLTVTNNNNTTNSAKLEVHHDQAKSQLLGSPDLTINVQNGENGSAELTTVDVNPDKVLKHDNLKTGYGISKKTVGNISTIATEYTRITEVFDLDTLLEGNVRSNLFINAPTPNEWYLVSAGGEGRYTVQKAVNLTDNKNTTYLRLRYVEEWGQWREQVGDKSDIDDLLAQKQDTLTSNASIGVDGTGLRQVYTQKQTYTHTNGTLKTHVKSVSQNTSVSTVEEEFHFLAKMNKTQTSASFSLNEHDTAVFEYLIDTYGENGTVNIHGSAFSLNDSTLTFLTNTGAQYNPHVITFSDIIPSNAINPTQTTASRVEKVDIDKEQTQ